MIFDGDLIEGAEKLHTGVWGRHNNNKWYVVWLHYTADPDKNPNNEIGKRWFEKAREGISQLDWDKEHEIDWFAKSGQLIYPEFDHSYLIDPFDIPNHWTKFMAFDVGIRNPSAGLWCAISEDGFMYLYREYYQRNHVVKDHVKHIMYVENRTKEKIFARYIDPSAGNRSHVINSSVSSEFSKYGIHFTSSVNDSVAGISKIRTWLKKDNSISKLRVFRNLTNFIKEIKEYRWEELKTDVYIKDPRDKPQKKSDHLMNCLEYLANENIRYYKTIPYDYENHWYLRSKRDEEHGFGIIEGNVR